MARTILNLVSRWLRTSVCNHKTDLTLALFVTADEMKFRCWTYHLRSREAIGKQCLRPPFEFGEIILCLPFLSFFPFLFFTLRQRTVSLCVAGNVDQAQRSARSDRGSGHLRPGSALPGHTPGALQRLGAADSLRAAQ